MVSELQINIMKKTFLKHEYFVMNIDTNEMTYVHKDNKLKLNLMERSVRLNESEERIRLVDLGLSRYYIGKVFNDIKMTFPRNINMHVFSIENKRYKRKNKCN